MQDKPIGFAKDKPFGFVQDKPISLAKGKPFDFAKDKPFDFAKDKPFDFAKDKQARILGGDTMAPCSLGRRITVVQRTLDPLIQVRILAPQPGEIPDLNSH